MDTIWWEEEQEGKIKDDNETHTWNKLTVGERAITHAQARDFVNIAKAPFLMPIISIIHQI